MKKYNIIARGKTFTVEVKGMQAPPEAAPVIMPVGAKAAAEEAVKAPMPGTVVQVLVKPGQSVEMGDALLTLEAMKMINEIMAPAAGTIGEVPVTQGASVDKGDLLVSMK